ncbi:hypothetical protein Rsub_00326 [Raphidocelis subcapitata]|uniref:Protein kinase domain-containing protein n=1 Tax=Raphidocelis subcapitata TaxID=307507 RepID=A0A2V0NS04_9CHLO|nr:hypothetical protein Rsub_00326 [Raphidocelis subcapitata]|eukprot:GBF87615.1 hypothetical protein Rsub_00326 [Raphidocelis subcapitata]
MGGCVSSPVAESDGTEAVAAALLEGSGRPSTAGSSSSGAFGPIARRAGAASDLHDLLSGGNGAYAPICSAGSPPCAAAAGAAAGRKPGARPGAAEARGPEGGGAGSWQVQGQAGILQYMNDLLLELQMVSGSAPGLVLPELAARLVAQLKEVDLCRVEAIIHTDAAPAAGVLLAAHGAGAAVCEETPVVTGDSAHCWSVLRERQAFYVPSAAAFEAGGHALPRDFAALHARAGLNCFLSVLIAAGPRVLGSLTIAARREGAFGEPWWQPVLTMAAAALLPHLRNRQLVALCRMLVEVDAEQDAAEAASLVIHGISHFMRCTTNVPMAVRLGLLHGDRILVIEQDPHVQSGASGSAGASSHLHTRRVVASDIPLSGTLLNSALAAGKARFVSDAAAYALRALSPAADVFTPASQLVASLVVVPLAAPPAADAAAAAPGGGAAAAPGGAAAAGGGAAGPGGRPSSPGGGAAGGGAGPFGGIYFALDAPDDFLQLQSPILGVVSMVSVLLHRKLGGQAEALRGRIAAATLSPPASNSRSAAGHAEQPNGGGGGAAQLAAAAAAAAPAAPAALCVESGAASFSVQTSSLSFTSKRLNTDAIMKAVQLKLAMSHNGPDAHASACDARRTMDGLVLEEPLGRGGYGVCYRGHFRGATVAVKVLYARAQQREAMKDAVEMAVLSHIRHPGIVSVYSCFTDCVEDDAWRGPCPRYRPALPDDSGLTANVIVMEYCDMGTLRDAVRRGLFHVRLPGGVVAVDLLKVVKVLLEVARSVVYLHERKLLHCDLKLDNVLLKSDLAHDLGFVCKLADFGLTKMMNEDLYAHNRSGSGTVTHLAPEVLRAGSRLTAAVDSYAFGVLAYELYTGSRAFGGLHQDKIIEAVAQRGLRPLLPADAPEPLAGLVNACWAPDPAARPGFDGIASALGGILASIEAAEEEALLMDEGFASGEEAAHAAGGGAGGGLASGSTGGSDTDDGAAAPRGGAASGSGTRSGGDQAAAAPSPAAAAKRGQW